MYSNTLCCKRNGSCHVISDLCGGGGGAVGKEVCCKKPWCVVVSALDFQLDFLLEDKMISGFRPGFLGNLTSTFSVSLCPGPGCSKQG